MRTVNSSPAVFQYDVSLVTYDAAAKFNLARLDATGSSGIRNVAIEGDMLTSVTSAGRSWFGLSNNTGGIRMPNDALAGVAIRDLAPHYAIAAQSIQAVAFGSHRKEDGKIESGPKTSRGEAQKLLAAGTALVPGSNTFRVPFAEPQQVAMFFVESAKGGAFTDKPLLFSVQDVVTAVDPLDITKGNRIEKSNADRGAVVALVTAIPGFDDKGKQTDSNLLAVEVRGDGGSIDIRQSLSTFVTNESMVNQFENQASGYTPYQTKKTKANGLFVVTPRVSSSSPLGDLTFRAPMDGDIQATSIFGSLVVEEGPLAGTIQTTGMRTDPISGETSFENPGDVGRLFVTYDHKGKASFATTVLQAGGGGLTGQFLVRGDLISQVVMNGGISGTIAVEGNVGIGAVEGAVSKRLGGILSNGGLNGEIIVFDSVEGGQVQKQGKGRVIGELVINGGIRDGGRIAVQGDIDSLIINGTIARGSAVVVGGDIENLNAKHVDGILAVNGAIDNRKFGKTDKAEFYGQNLSGVNADAVDAVFLHDQIDGGVTSFDENDLDLFYLSLVRDRLGRLRASCGQLEF